MARLTASGSELTWDETQRVNHHHRRAMAEAEQGSGERPAMQFLFWSPQQDWQRRLGRALRVSSLRVPFAEQHARSKAVGGSAGHPSDLGAQPVVSLADCHRSPQGCSLPLVRTAPCRPYRRDARDVLFKGRPVPQPSCLIQTPRAALEFSPST